jgi:hypothetical protein
MYLEECINLIKDLKDECKESEDDLFIPDTFGDG